MLKSEARLIYFWQPSGQPVRWIALLMRVYVDDSPMYSQILGSVIGSRGREVVFQPLTGAEHLQVGSRGGGR